MYLQDAADARAQFVSLRREMETERSTAAAKLLHLDTSIKNLKAQNDAHVAHAQHMASCQDYPGIPYA